jgi:hypothetical protein
LVVCYIYSYPIEQFSPAILCLTLFHYPLFKVLRPAQEYFTYLETSPLPVKGYKEKNKNGPMLGALGREGIFVVPRLL